MTVRENMKESLKNSKDVNTIMREIYNQVSEQDRSKEHFWILELNTKNQINYIELVSLGSLNTSPVHPREVFKIAIMKDTASIIACHNHPSGDTHPSVDDITITKRLQEAGKIIGINLIDHLIIADGKYYSLMENGLINN
ncbi:hypothetical protein LCGC14_0359370 [marine sediment metagenome]|uniref:MPN domain-containing protein n=1 Tax=marine sediment metagenome TaxID=412755 RepID=A0A0F9TRF1_9ZZZZ|nr:hypothetical protein [Candidatus Aminicenantes bacterium]